MNNVDCSVTTPQYRDRLPNYLKTEYVLELGTYSSDVRYVYVRALRKQKCSVRGKKKIEGKGREGGWRESWRRVKIKGIEGGEKKKREMYVWHLVWVWLLRTPCKGGYKRPWIFPSVPSPSSWCLGAPHQSRRYIARTSITRRWYDRIRQQ